MGLWFTLLLPGEVLLIKAQERKLAEEGCLANNEVPALHVAVPDCDPCWDANVQGENAIFMLCAYRQHVLMAIWHGMPKTLNLSKAYAIRQQDAEAPRVFYERLLKAFHQYTNIDPTDANTSRMMLGIFIKNSAPDSHKKLQKTGVC